MKKKILALCLVVVLAITAVTGATLAYFTDTDSKTNTFTSGNVKIIQNEKDRNGNDYGEDSKILLPIVDDKKDENGYHMGANYIDKIVTVTNDGTQPAFIRTHLAIPTELDNTFNAGENILHWNGASANDTFGAANWGGDIENDWYWGKDTTNDWPGNTDTWNFYKATVGNVEYNVYVATHGTAVEAGDTTAPNLFGVYLDARVNYDADAKEYYIGEGTAKKVINLDAANTKILVLSEAVQSEGFEKYEDQDNVAFYALDKAFGTIGSYNPFVK